jgi:hypothetical protein
VATKRVQTPRQQPNQVRLQPQASVVDTFVRPARNDQISKALDSVTGNVKRVEVKEERRLDMIQASKKQSAQNTFNIGYKALLDQDKFAEMPPEQLKQTPEFQQLYNTSSDMVDDEDLKGMLHTSMSSLMFATSTASSQQWARKRLRDAGAEFASATFSIGVDEGMSLYNLTPTNAAHGPDGMDKEMLRDELLTSMPSRVKDIETVLKEKYGYSNTDLQNFWLKEQEKRGIQHEDTLIGDYLLEAGHGGPDYRNKVIALNEKADNAKLRSDQLENIDNIMNWKTAANSGLFTLDSPEGLAAYKSMKAGITSTAVYQQLVSDNQSALSSMGAKDRADTSMMQSVAQMLAGNATLGFDTYFDKNNKEVTHSQKDIERATQKFINKRAEELGGTPEEILGRQVKMYSNANVLNEQWVSQFGKAFDMLGTGELTPESPQWGATLQRFQLMKQVHQRNPELFKKYLKGSQQLIQFNDWRVISAYGNSEVDALRDVGSKNALDAVIASKADQAKFAADIVTNLDTWGWGDVVGEDEALKTLFNEKMVQYARVISKYSQMNPAEIVEYYRDEVKRDHSVVNGKMVYIGGNDQIDNSRFQEDAELYLQTNKVALGLTSYNTGDLTLRHTGRGDTFWIVDQRGMTVDTAPLRLKSFHNLTSSTELTQAQMDANDALDRKQNPNKTKAR